MKNKVIKKLVINASALAMFCIIGMFSFAFGENVKVSLQLLFVFIIGLVDILDVYDCLEITTCYLLLGLFLPVYAGFNVGVTPTFGYVIGFIFASVWIKIINILMAKKLKINKYVSGIVSCLLGLLFTYIVGTIFFSAYLNFEGGFWNLLLVTVIPYIPFDIIKIIIACVVSFRINKVFVHLQDSKKEIKSDEEE